MVLLPPAQLDPLPFLVEPQMKSRLGTSDTSIVTAHVLGGVWRWASEGLMEKALMDLAQVRVRAVF